MKNKQVSRSEDRVYVLTADTAKEVNKAVREIDADQLDVLYVHPDQLNLDVFPEDLLEMKPWLLFVESKADSSILPFHKKKLVLERSAQRHFARDAAGSGCRVLEIRTGMPSADIFEALLDDKRVILHVMEPVSHQPRNDLEKLSGRFKKRVQLIPNGFFLAAPEPWKEKIRSGYRMEFFYREMRRQTGYLMKDGKPEGGEWNYDDSNRKSLPKGEKIPDSPGYPPDKITKEVIEDVERDFPNHFGETDGFCYAVTRDQTLEVLDGFIANRLARFGPYQDAMATGEPFLFHSLLSPYMNLGLLTAREVCEAVLEAYDGDSANSSTRKSSRSSGDSDSGGKKGGGDIPLSSVEGFIRQIIGWREYMWVYYEAMMPDVRSSNHFSYRKPLPELFWSGETEMRCMRESVGSVLKHGYAHHIQRLMVLSNFSNLTATDPFELFEWFWYGFVDAHEWVVLPNVLGMSTFADGGVLASKPYIAGGNYIRKMSNYCSDCRYRVQDRTGKDACPFNYLYWAFVDREQDDLKKNPRIGFMLKTWNKKSEDEKEEIRKLSSEFIDNLKRYDEKIATTR